MTFGFSRDDVEGRMMDAYLELGLLPRNAFEVVELDGVGELVRLGTERGRPPSRDSRSASAGSTGATPVHRPLLRRRARLRQLLALPGPRGPAGPAQAVLAEKE